MISLDSHAGILMEPFNGGADHGSADPEANAPLEQEALLDLEVSLFHSNSYLHLSKISRSSVVPLCKINDAPLLRALEGTPFETDWGEDGSGLLMKFLRRGGGYYMSVGCSELIAAGEVNVKKLGGGEVVKVCEGGGECVFELARGLERDAYLTTTFS